VGGHGDDATYVTAQTFPCCGIISDALKAQSELPMNLNLSIGPLVSLIAGVLILVMPRLLNYIVAIYLIVIGLLGLFGTGNFHLK
jgi:hypothetical protein